MIIRKNERRIKKNDYYRMSGRRRSEFGGNDKFVTTAGLLEPLTNPCL